MTEPVLTADLFPLKSSLWAEMMFVPGISETCAVQLVKRLAVVAGVRVPSMPQTVTEETSLLFGIT